MRFPRPRRIDTLVAAVASLAMVLAVVAVVAVRLLTTPADRVPAGVSIGGIAVGGLSADEAERAVVAGARPPTGAVAIDLPGEPGFPMRVPLAQLGPAPRAHAAVSEALRRPSLPTRILGEVGLEPGRDVPVRFRATPARARAVAARIAGGIDTPARPAALRVDAGGVVVSPARAGRGVDAARLVALLAPLPARVPLPIGPVDPAVSDAQAEVARATAERIAAGPVVVRAGGRGATISRADLLGALRFTPGADGIAVTLAPGAVRKAVAPSLAPALGPARSAGFRVSGLRVSVVPARAGRHIDAEALARLIEVRTGNGAISAPVVAEAPVRTTADAQRLRIRERVSTFTTPFACCQPRVTNIQRAAAILDGTIIPAGATFSLNQILGERTLARGFVSAPQINAGQLEDAVGGGVSQMATTIYNASFFAGLRIVTHTPHEFWITRYPPGREATVSWGGPELIVENDWPAAILMRVEATDTALTVSMYSSTLGRRVSTTSTGDAVAGTAFTETTTRTVWRGDVQRSDETYRWAYKAPPASE